MKAILFLLSYFFFGILFSTDYQALPNNQTQEDEKQYLYIYAPNGLNMRDGPTIAYKKLTKIPYGAKVEVIVPAEVKSIQVDGLSGGMAKVSYEGITGYAFDGYMGQFQAPSTDMKVRTYVDALRGDGHLVYYEKVERDYDGYFQFEESIIIHKSDWEEAFLVAKELFSIPPKLNFPPNNKKSESTYVNPDKREISWSDEMVVNREQGQITSMTYTYRAEGGGMAVSIGYFEPDSEAIKITQLGIAD